MLPTKAAAASAATTEKDSSSFGRFLWKHLELLKGEDGIENTTDGKVRVLSPMPASESEASLPFTLRVSMEGPDGTAYSGLTLAVEVVVPPRYPFAAPSVWFVPPIWHPNVGPEHGQVFLDFLTDEKVWSPAWSLNKILLAVFAVLRDPVLDGPGTSIFGLLVADVVNVEASKDYKKKSRDEYSEIVWSHIIEAREKEAEALKGRNEGAEKQRVCPWFCWKHVGAKK